MCAVHIGPASPPFSKDAFFVVGVKIVLSLDPPLVVCVPISVPLLQFHVVVVIVVVVVIASSHVIVVIRKEPPLCVTSTPQRGNVSWNKTYIGVFSMKKWRK